MDDTANMDKDMPDTLVETLPNTIGETVAGVQNTPAYWKKDIEIPEQPVIVLSQPQTFAFCTYDEDETQIQYCSNVISQEMELHGNNLSKGQLMVNGAMQEESTKIHDDEYIGDGESSNESEDLWAGGESTLDQQPLDVFEEGIQRSKSPNLTNFQMISTPATKPLDNACSGEETEIDEEPNTLPLTCTTNEPPSSKDLQGEAYYDKIFQSKLGIPEPDQSITSPPTVLEPRGQIEEPPIMDQQSKHGDQVDSTAPSLQVINSTVEESIQSSIEKSLPPRPVVRNPFQKLQNTSSISSFEESTSDAVSEHPPRMSRRRLKPTKYSDSVDLDETQASSVDDTVVKKPAIRKRGSKRSQSSLEDTMESATSRKASSSSQFTTQESVADLSAESHIRIVLTGLDATSFKRKINALKGASFEEDVTRGTHLVAPRGELKRTVKMLCGISTCLHVLDESWLHASIKAGAPVAENRYCLHDKAKESQWNFVLKETMYSRTLAQRSTFLSGLVFFIPSHESIKPAPEDLQKIIECAGGEVSQVIPVDGKIIVITSEVAMSVKSVQTALCHVDPSRICTPELILSGILRQSLDFESSRASVVKPHKGKTSKRNHG